MSRIVDTSVLLAVFWHEPGAARASETLSDARMSAVNLSEFVSKLVDRGLSVSQIDGALQTLPVEIVAFDDAQARAAGLLRDATRQAGLSLGDRACLALALAEQASVVTADRAWSRLDVGVAIELIR